MVFILLILIAYGLSLIIVQGKIFEELKFKYNRYIFNFNNYLNPNDDIFKNVNEIKDLDQINKNLFIKICEKIKNSKNDDPNFEELLKIYEDCRISIKKSLYKKRNTTLNKLLLFGLSKFNELINCMMCTGFWAGIVLTILSIIFNISIGGVSFILIQSSNTYDVVITTFLIGILTSGTTWIINCIVDFLYEIKENIGLFTKRN